MPVLVHRGERDSLPDRTTAERRIADIGDNDARLAVDALVERGARRDRARAADDRVVRVDPEWGKERVHRPAQPAVEAGGAREDLAVGPVDEEPERQPFDRPAVTALDRTEQGAVRVGLHDGLELAIAELPDRGKALREDLAVAAMGSEDVIVGRQRKRHPHCRRLLPDRQMGRPGMVVGHALVGALGLDLLKRRLELPNSAHVPPDVQQILDRVLLELLRDGLVVGVERNLGETDGFPREHALRLDNDGLGHALYTALSLKSRRFKGSGVQGFRGSRVQGFKGSALLNL